MVVRVFIVDSISDLHTCYLLLLILWYRQLGLKMTPLVFSLQKSTQSSRQVSNKCTYLTTVTVCYRYGLISSHKFCNNSCKEVNSIRAMSRIYIYWMVHMAVYMLHNGKHGIGSAVHSIANKVKISIATSDGNHYCVNGRYWLYLHQFG